MAALATPLISNLTKIDIHIIQYKYIAHIKSIQKKMCVPKHPENISMYITHTLKIYSNIGLYRSQDPSIVHM